MLDNTFSYDISTTVTNSSCIGLLTDLLLSDGYVRYSIRLAANSVNTGFMKARQGSSVK